GKEPQRIVLAGAFGSHIDIKYAMILGLIPDCDLQKVASVGNAAGTGARIALLNKESRRVVEKTVRNIIKIETATASDFQEFFVDAMAFPHKSDAFPKLRAQVNMPKRAAPQDDTTKRRRKRRRNHDG
ncbi:MAG: ASKHA domain-containing protein, partial [Pseudomonadota bacterium]